MNTPATHPHVSQSTAVYDLRAIEISVSNGSEQHGQNGVRYLRIVEGDVWIVLGNHGADLAAEAEALRKLAGLATEIADELEGRTLTCGNCGASGADEPLRKITSTALADRSKKVEWACADAKACNDRRFPDMAKILGDDVSGDR